jgi:hypothetical protein
MLWLVSLALWAHVLRGRMQMIGVAAAQLLSAGGAFSAYLVREFGAPTQAFDWAGNGYLGPVVGSLALIEAGPRTGTAWAFLGTHLVVAILASAGLRARHHQRPVLA